MALGAVPVAPRWALPHNWGETGLQWNKGVTAPASPAQLLEERDSPFQATEFPGPDYYASGQDKTLVPLGAYRLEGGVENMSDAECQE